MRRKHFAEFYDAIASKAGARRRATTMLSYVKRYRPGARTILELGTGNGNVLSSFPKKYELYGLDIEEKYIELTRQKVPTAQLFVASMHEFKIHTQFDVVFSIFDCINYLKNFRQWEQTFSTVHKHLKRNGLFIFDMLTPNFIEYAKHTEPKFSKHSFGFAADDAAAIVGGNRVTQEFRIFEKAKGDVYRMHRYFIVERIFSPSRVEEALKRKFHIISRVPVEFSSWEAEKRASRLLYVTRKRSRLAP
jgi:SAM-dependent methyltransferase